MTIRIELYWPGVAEVSFVPSLWRRIFRRARTVERTAALYVDGCWRWLDGDERITDPDVLVPLKAAQHDACARLDARRGKAARR